MPFAALDHTADLGVEVWAASLGELFAEAAAALCATISDCAGVEPRRERAIELVGAAPDLLLVDWLQELLYRFEATGELYSWCAAEVSEAAEGMRLQARLRGEPFDPQRHPLHVAVKAVTYHGLEVRRAAGHWRARVIFDV